MDVQFDIGVKSGKWYGVYYRLYVHDLYFADFRMLIRHIICDLIGPPVRSSAFVQQTIPRESMCVCTRAKLGIRHNWRLSWSISARQCIDRVKRANIHSCLRQLHIYFLVSFTSF